MAGVSAFLIVTPQGDILTDGGLPESAPFIEKNIQALGFKLSDVKILLNSHAHFDHSGGLAKLKADTGAKFYASTGDAPFLESGHIPYGPSSRIDTAPVKVDRAMKDGDSFTLGGVTMTAHVLPGHTKGCTTWTMPLTDAGVAHKVMFFCSISVAGNPIAGKLAYPTIVADYRASFARLKKMDADIFFAPHGGQFHMDEKLAKMKPGAPNPFIDPERTAGHGAEGGGRLREGPGAATGGRRRLRSTLKPLLIPCSPRYIPWTARYEWRPTFPRALSSGLSELMVLRLLRRRRKCTVMKSCRRSPIAPARFWRRAKG